MTCKYRQKPFERLNGPTFQNRLAGDEANVAIVNEEMIRAGNDQAIETADFRIAGFDL